MAEWYNMQMRMLSVLAVVTLFLVGSSERPVLAAEASPMFRVAHSVALFDPFMRLLRTGTDNSPFPPYYEPWAPLHRTHVAADLRAAGFDAVRLPVSPVPLMELDEPERQRVYQQFSVAINDLLANGLNVVFDLHVISETNPKNINNRTLTAGIDDPRFTKYLGLVSSVGRYLASFDPHRVAFELFNEPPPPCEWKGVTPWSAYQKKLFTTARNAAPKTTFVLTGPCWSAADGLLTVAPGDYDDNVIYTIHFYEPTIFTAQGQIGSTFGQYLSRIPYPPTTNRSNEFYDMLRTNVAAVPKLDAAFQARILSQGRAQLEQYFSQPQGQETITRQLAKVSNWAKQNRIDPHRIWVGEFGVQRDIYGRLGATPDDRERWLRAARTAFEQLGFGWSVWGYCCQTGIITGERLGPLDPHMLSALGLRDSGARQ